MISIMVLMHLISKRKKNKELGSINSNAIEAESSDEVTLEKEITVETNEIINNMDNSEVKECLD